MADLVDSLIKARYDKVNIAPPMGGLKSPNIIGTAKDAMGLAGEMAGASKKQAEAEQFQKILDLGLEGMKAYLVEVDQTNPGVSARLPNPELYQGTQEKQAEWYALAAKAVDDDNRKKANVQTAEALTGVADQISAQPGGAIMGQIAKASVPQIKSGAMGVKDLADFATKVPSASSAKVDANALDALDSQILNAARTSITAYNSKNKVPADKSKREGMLFAAAQQIDPQGFGARLAKDSYKELIGVGPTSDVPLYGQVQQQQIEDIKQGGTVPDVIIQRFDKAGISDYDKKLAKISDLKQQAAQMISAIDEDSTAGDIAAVYKYMKALDPESVVRESEVKMAQQIGGILDKIGSTVTSIAGTAKLTQNQRNEMRSAITAMVGALDKGMIATRSRYRDRSKIVGADGPKYFDALYGEYQPMSLAIPAAKSTPAAPKTPAPVNSKAEAAKKKYKLNY